MLLATVLAGEKRLQPVQLQKLLFLFGQGLKDTVGDNYYNFQPYHYGPFDSTVYLDAEELSSQGLVDLVERPGVSWKEYKSTVPGQEAAEVLLKTLPGDVAKWMRDVVLWVQSVSFEKLISEIYRLYPQYKSRSIFRG